MSYVIPSLEYHILDACNLSCDWCTHYANFKQPKNLQTVAGAKAEWQRWAGRVTPRLFCILGGEPTLHPDLCEFVRVAGEVWSASTVRVFTNGFFLDRHPGLPDAIGSGELIVSLHCHDRELERRIRATVAPWIRSGLRVEFWDSRRGWRQFYQIQDGRPVPFAGEKYRSYEACSAKHCKVLRDGKLWKCPQVAFASSAGIDWPHFAAYKPLEIDGDLDAFFAAGPEDVCSHCPTTPQIVTKPDPRTSKLPVLSSC